MSVSREFLAGLVLLAISGCGGGTNASVIQIMSSSDAALASVSSRLSSEATNTSISSASISASSASATTSAASSSTQSSNTSASISSSTQSSASSTNVPAGNPGLRNANGTTYTPHSDNIAPHIINVVTRTGELGNTIDLADSTSDDQAAILAVLNDSQTTVGSTLYFPNGTYNISTLALSKSGINFEGESRAGTIFKSTLNGSGSVMSVSGKNNLVIKNITFTSTWNSTYPTDTNSNNPNAGGPDYAIAIGSNAYNVTIDNVIVEKYRRMGIRLASGSHDVVVKNSLARNATDIGDGGNGYGFVIQGNTHVNGSTNPFLGDNTKDSYFNVIENNVAQGPYIRHAVVVQYWAHNNVVRNNTFDQSQLDAIDSHGEDEYANEFANNTVTDSARAGIGLGNNGATHDKTGVNNWVHDNTLIGCGWGITVQYGTDSSTIENNIIRDNSSNTASPKCAICLGKSSNSVLRNNTISNYSIAGYTGVLLMDDPTVNDEPAGGPTHWLIEGNHVSNSGTPFQDNATMDGANTIQSTW